MPNTDILIVSCAKHFQWLRFALFSCKRFATGFRQVKVLVPEEDLSAITPLLTELSQIGGISIKVQCYDDWPGKGFLRHEHVIMCSDEFTDADFIYHMDSDCMFVEPTTPDDYIVDGKPVLLQASYDWLITQQANLGMWKDGVEKALGGISTREFMRRPQMTHHRKTYAKARECIEAHTGMRCADYIRSGRNEFPQLFGEFNTLGEVAWRHFHSDYCWPDQELGEFPKPHKVVQFSSGNSPAGHVFALDQPQMPYYKDQPFECTPESLLKMV